MDKSILYKNYLETKIYLDERDGSCNYANDLRRKYQELIDLVDISKIFIKIVNYRVKKYGTSRIGYTDWDNATYEEHIKYGKNKQQIQLTRRKKYDKK